MMQLAYISAAFIVFTPLALATWRGWPTHWLLALTAIALALAGGVLTLMTTTSLVLSQPSDNAFHDTYYVVTHGHWVARQAVAFAILFLLNWAAYRYARRPSLHLKKAAVWGLAIGFIAPSLFRWNLAAPPQRYIDYDTWLQTILITDQIGALIAAASMLVLFFIPAYALVWARA